MCDKIKKNMRENSPESENTVNACDMEIKPQSIKLIWKELETRQEYFEGGLL